MLRLIAATGILLAITFSPTFACSLPEPLIAVDLVTGAVQEVPPPQRTPEQIAASLPEVVLDGVVVEREPITGEPGATNSHFRKARMRVDRAWKGAAAEFITLEFGEPGSMCEAVPPVGEPLRVSLDPISPNVFSYDMLSYFAPRGPNEDAGLQLYRDRTLALQRKAEIGGPVEKRAFAAYLQRNGETHRALWMYEALIRQVPHDLESLLALTVLQGANFQDEDADDTLKQLIKLAPKTEEWRGKIARATFEATGLLTADWKDWSNIESNRSCHVVGNAFDGANFDGARLGCAFTEYATFHNASFKGADLSNSDFLVRPDVKGAAYDCATRMPRWIDPVAEGMIKVDGDCTKAPPQ